MFFFLKTPFLFVNIFQPVGDDTEDCRIELEPGCGVLEPREEKKSITVHFIANRTVGICVMLVSWFILELTGRWAIK